MSLKSKIQTRKKLISLINKLKKKGKIIAFSNGCFDILHYGHVKYLEDAKRLTDILIIGLNSDSSIKKIKGKNRPITRQKDRGRVLAALSPVDYLTVFNQPTPIELIKLIKPDILIKGGDWKETNMVGGDFVKSYGGKVVTIPYLKGYSTTALINRIKHTR